MKRTNYFFFWITLFFFTFIITATATNAEKMLQEKPIVIVTAGYNNARWYQRNLDSIFMQKYSNYKLLYTDDGSPDGTGKLVAEYIKQKGMEHKVELTCNPERLGNPLVNQYRMIHSCPDNAIIIIVDADDWLAHDQVLNYINKIYQEHDVWLTYGQYQEWPSGALGFNKPIPQHIIQNNLFRNQYYAFSHLRTHYAWLFKKIKLEDITIDGKFLAMSGDIAVMLPMTEMARDHFAFIADVLYIYNGANELSEHRISKQKQRDIDLWVRSRPPYKKAEWPNGLAR
jgi:glycosyltransferase involved in cell wall biosynthesis